MEFVLDPAARLSVLQSLTEKLTANDIFPDVAEQICAGLQKHQAEGEYNNFDEKVMSGVRYQASPAGAPGPLLRCDWTHLAY